MQLVNAVKEKLQKQPKSTLLSSRDLKGIAEYIQSDRCKKITILAGAGISVSAGIPDFRSSDGFYNTLNTSDFPMLTADQIVLVESDPQYILTIYLFKENPSVYLHARKEFLLSGSKYKPTPTHWFFKLLEDHHLLKRFYSTNIDGLDVATNLDPNVLVHVHGTCGRAVCLQCNAEYPMDELRECLESNAHLKGYVTCNECNDQHNYIKPDTVLFGQSLPDIYWQLVDEQDDLDDVDLLIVAGTSLCVRPSCSIPQRVDQSKCVRLLANRELPKGFNVGPNDVFYRGDCDDAFRELAELLGWKEELEQLIGGNMKGHEENDEGGSKQLKENENDDEKEKVIKIGFDDWIDQNAFKIKPKVEDMSMFFVQITVLKRDNKKEWNTLVDEWKEQYLKCNGNFEEIWEWVAERLNVEGIEANAQDLDKSNVDAKMYHNSEEQDLVDDEKEQDQ